MSPSSKTWKKIGWLCLGLVAFVLLAAAAIWLLVPLPSLAGGESLQVFDRHGQPLYEQVGDGHTRLSWLPLERISPWIVRATLFKEDRHFFRHPGVNPLRMMKALFVNLKRGRIVQGGSTVTMQLAKILRHRRGRSLAAKAGDLLLAMKLEMSLSKREILSQYLNRIYFGNQLFGCESASQAYFGRPAGDLSLAQAAILSAITSAPSHFNPYTRWPEVQEKARSLIAAMRQRGWIDARASSIALQERVELRPLSRPLLAPHFVLHLLEGVEKEIYGLRRIQATIDLPLQQELEGTMRAFLSTLASRKVTQGAMLVLDSRTGEVLAWVGSTDFWNDADSGKIDGCLIRRQPGSALKPFLYACALQRGFHAASVLSDLPATFSEEDKTYVPRNYTSLFSGPQRLRVALASSLNVPAVETLVKVGKSPFYALLRRVGFSSLDRGERYYGLGLVLGSGEVTLRELTSAYAMLARGGIGLEVRLVSRLLAGRGPWQEAPKAKPGRVLDRRLAFILSSILSDPDSRGVGFSEETPLQFPYQVAVKTGTSEGFRDNFCIGYTADFTIGVWVGNFTGESMHQVSGVTGAAPLFHLAMNTAYRHRLGRIPYGTRSLEQRPPGIVERDVCSLSGMLAGPDCSGRVRDYFLAEEQPARVCDWHRGLEVDARNGLLATAQTPARFREHRVFLEPPAPYREWAARSGYRFPPLDYSRLGEQEFAIVSPVDRAVLQRLVDLPSQYQTVRLQLRTTLRGQRVAWRVDDRPISHVGFPFAARWRIEAGSHVISVQSDDGKLMDRIHVYVQ